MRTTLKILSLSIALLAVANLPALAQERFEPFKYGDMNNWITRHIKESGIIGGNTKTLYEIGPEQTIDKNEAFVNQGGSPWGTSNVMAKVSGITKTNTSVYRDKRGDGYCCKMVTHIETCKVLGLINIKVLAAGSIFLGSMREPITGTKDGVRALNWGVPFTKRPKAIKYDYKISVPGNPNRIKMTGFGGKSTVEGPDLCTTVVYLQKRTEDSEGNVTAKRVGTMVVTYGKSTKGWVNGAKYDIWYGDIRNHPGYNEQLMGLRSDSYVRNSKGKHVLLTETGWASPDETPTHIIVQFSSSHGGAFVGTVGNTMWVDNVGLVY